MAIQQILIGLKGGSTHTVSISPSPSTATMTTCTGGTTYSTATATPAGGVGPYTYLWSFVSGTPLQSTTNGTAATQGWDTEDPFCDSPGVTSGVYRCTVTDTGNGSVTAFADVTVTHTRSY